MANQMIALGARAPQMPDLGRATQQYGAMLGVAAQQRASQRQAEQAEQAMEIARNQEQRAVATHEIEQAGRQIEFYTKLAGQTMNRAGYEQFLGRLDRDAPEIAAQFRTNLPPENFDRNSLLQMVGSIADNFSRTFAPLNTEVVQDEHGDYRIIERGGFRGPRSLEIPEFNIVRPAAGAPAPAAGAPAPAAGAPAPAAGAPVAPAATPTARVPRGGGDVTPQDLMGQGIPMSAIPMGDPRMRPMSAEAGAGGAAMTPASFGGEMGGVQPLTLETAPQIIQNAVQSRMIDQTHLQQLREMVGPDNERNLASWMQSNQIRIQPTGGMAQPSLRSAEYRPGTDAAPQFQQVQASAGPEVVYAPTGRTARGRPPLVSPTQEPSSAGAVAGATEAAEQNVRVTTQPQIRAGEERAVRIERLREQLPSLRSDAESAISDMTKRIESIDRFLRHPYRATVIGAIEGNLPRLAQFGTRADVQALWDTITNNEVLGSIIASRAQTETGGSLVGVVSDRDLQLLVRAASPLTQTGEVHTQEENMRRLRRELYNARNRIVRRYDDVLRPLGAEAEDYRVQVRFVEPRYIARPARRTPTRSAAPSRTSSGAGVIDWNQRR